LDPDFTRPGTVEEALRDLGSEGAVAVGGGTQVAVLTKHGLLEPSRLVWLGRIGGLAGISSPDGAVVIGAGTTLAEIAGSSAVRTALPALAQAAGHVGNARVRAVATLAGHLVHADPRQDLPPVLLVLDAAVRVVGPGGERDVPLSEFFVGLFETALRDGELVTSVRVPPVSDGARVSYVRFTPGTDNDYPTVGVAARVAVADGVVRHAVVGLGGVDSRPLRVELPSLAGRPADPAAWREAGDVAAAACDPSSDQRGSAGYKRAMARLWTARALAAAADGS
jgi:aerobic carbon-monoxide dehydrogenase medium subunit